MRPIRHIPLMRQGLRYYFSEDGAPELTTENAQKIIGKWVKNNKVCLFMKGTPATPQCGYSNFVV